MLPQSLVGRRRNPTVFLDPEIRNGVAERKQLGFCPADALTVLDVEGNLVLRPKGKMACPTRAFFNDDLLCAQRPGDSLSGTVSSLVL